MILEIIEKVNSHKKRLTSYINEINGWKTFDLDIFNDSDKIKTIDAFIYRFIKMINLMSEKLFKTFLNNLGEYEETMSLIDVLDKLEKFKIIKDANSWIEYRKLREQLTNELRNNKEDIIAGIKIAIKNFEDIEIIFYNIIMTVENKYRSVGNARKTEI